MQVTYRDNLGYITVTLDAYGDGVSFFDGFAWFSDGERDYKIPVANLESIINE